MSNVRFKVTSQGVRDLNPPTSRPRRALTNPCVVGLHTPGRWRQGSFTGEEQLCANCGEVIDTRVQVTA